MAILFVTSTRIGDAILSTGLLSHLVETYPNDPVTIACGPVAAPIFEAVPTLSAIHKMKKGRRGIHWWRLWQDALSTRWRIVVDLRRSALPWTLRTRSRFSIPQPLDHVHRVALIARTMGLPPQSPRIWITDRHREIADARIRPDASTITIAPCANWIGKTWPATRFAEVASEVAGDRQVLVVGAPHERTQADAVFEALGNKAIDGFGLGLLPTYAAIQRSDLFIGNDSGLMHLAAATGRPTVGLFGPSDERLYGPWGDNGLAVRTPESVRDLIGGPNYDFRQARCMMDTLETQTVISAIQARWPAL